MKLNVLIILFSIVQVSFGQTTEVTITGKIQEKTSGRAIPYANVLLRKSMSDSTIAGTISNESGRFNLANLAPGNYVLSISSIGYHAADVPALIGSLNEYLDLGTIEIEENIEALNEVLVTGNREEVSSSMEKKTFNVTDNLSQAGGSALQMMQNLPGITTDQDGKIQLRGSDRVTILIDGQQTALTGFGNQTGLDNIPASAIEQIEIINNPSTRYDAQGMAGIINIVMKKDNQKGWNGKLALIGGLGALGEQRANISDISSQYLWNPSINPSLSLNYRKDKINFFFQGDLINQSRLNKNEFIQRTFANGDIINHQFLENRTQTTYTVKTGVDWYISDKSTLTLAGLFSREAHIDRGDLPYLDATTGERIRLWRYWEDEKNTSINFSSSYVKLYEQPGRKLQVGLNYTFHREDELFYFDNIQAGLIGTDTTFLIADENVTDLNIDYIRPLKTGRFELGSKIRWRYIPTNMEFRPGLNSIIDPGAAGWADYNELINAIYGTYVYEKNSWEMEAGLRVEYARLDYDVIPNHNTYESDGYSYLQPFPNLRFAYNVSENQKLSLFYNRRVDRPDEQDLRIFPKYDDPEVLKTGNPALRPQFSQSVELGSKSSWNTGYFYSAIYGRQTNNIITRILTVNPNNNLLNAISQNAGNGTNIGIEAVVEQEINDWYSINLNGNIYHNTISAFTIENLYPFNTEFSMSKQTAYSGTLKLNNLIKTKNGLNFQLTGIYLAPDIIPQGRIDTRFSVDFGVTKSIQSGRGELFVNGSDIFNTLRIQKETFGDGFILTSTDFFQTQMFRIGYSYKL